MTTLRFDGVTAQLRRGGWSAKALVTTERHGQLFETYLGSREFATETASREWLKQIAAERSIEMVRISTHPDDSNSAQPRR